MSQFNMKIDFRQGEDGNETTYQRVRRVDPRGLGSDTTNEPIRAAVYQVPEVLPMRDAQLARDSLHIAFGHRWSGTLHIAIVPDDEPTLFLY